MTHHLSLTPFRRVIRDYDMVCESYYQAIRTASPTQIEAIDMGRRGMHNEASELLQRAARRQGRPRLRHRAPPVHADLALHWKG